ncbi:MAG TPA: hypothetical protein PKV48_00400 [Thermodesulfobacteriota bacterium]|nr:hypothetical protein [Thermodesulfobacteriota bacterium]
MKKIILAAIILGILLLSKPLALLAQEPADGGGEVKVNEKSLTLMPCIYLKKNIVTEGVYLDASSGILDDWFHDKDTRFSSRDYLNFRTNLIFQYFIKQEKAEIIPALKAGDKIIISGFVTSCADKRPWIEVDSVVKVPSE